MNKAADKSRMQINYEICAIAELGKYVIFWSGENLLAGYFLERGESLKSFIEEVRKKWPEADFSEAVINGDWDYELLFKGTELEVAVWNALRKIPLGETWSYEKVALESGFPKAIRAVATAVGKNPLTWIVPCHRVVRKDGTIGNYRFGRELKKLILKTENIIF